MRARLQLSRMDDVFQRGLHEFISEFMTDNNRMGAAITEQFRHEPAAAPMLQMSLW